MAPSTVDLETLLELYGRMLLIRSFEERVAVLYRNGDIPGFVHLSIGQEATAVGTCSVLRTDDLITSTHRGHGHCLAKGLDPASMMAELMGKEAGSNRGRGGSMHVADPDLGILGANGIVAAGLPIAVGAAAASQLRRDERVVVAFFGDGAVAQGAFHEALNLAAIWRLPVVFFCENNHFAEFSSEAAQHPVTLACRAVAYDMPFLQVDGNDVSRVAEAMRDVVARVRSGGGPTLVEADTYRWHGHYEGDPERYRNRGELELWKERDPIARARAALEAEGEDPRRLEQVDSAVTLAIDAAVEAARAAAAPDPTTLGCYVEAASQAFEEPAAPAGPQEFRTMDAVRLALDYELSHDSEVFLAGVDVGKGGNVFGLTRGLCDRWPHRVLDTPISETAVMGLAVGAAMLGMRPVVELTYLDFIGVCFDQILNQAAKLRYMTGGRSEMALTVRTQFGAGRSSGSQHSQSLEALLAHVPGLRVVMPSNPAETYGLLRAAIHDPNPVIFIENRLQYGTYGPKPPSSYIVPLGRARIARVGSDVTIVSASRMVEECLAAAEQVAHEGIDSEVIDLRTIRPLDRRTILDSLSKTSRLVIAHEAWLDFGIGAEIAAIAADEGFWHLDAPIRRVGAPSVPAPYAPDLERAWLPNRATVAEAVRQTVAH